MTGGSPADAATRRPDFKSSGGCKNAQNPSLAIMGQMQGEGGGEPAGPGLDANRQGGGDVNVENKGVCSGGWKASFASDCSQGWFNAWNADKRSFRLRRHRRRTRSRASSGCKWGGVSASC